MGGDDDTKRGPALRRALALKVPAPDLAKDKGGALVVDVAAIDLGGDEVAEPLSTLAGGQ